MEDAERRLRDALSREPEDAAAMRTLAYVVVARGGEDHEAIELFRKSLDREDNPRARRSLQRLLNSRISLWHFDMLNDARRNAAYDRAIRRAVRPGDVVVDLGAGCGLLSLMAHRAGAGLVYSIEEEASLCGIAERVIAAHGLADRTRVLSMRASAARLAAPADVLVAEVFDSALVGEGALAALHDAARRLLRPGGAMVPRAASLHAAPVESPSLRRRSRVLGPVGGFDLASLNPPRSCRPGEPLEFEPLRGDAHRLLAAPARSILSFRFAEAGAGPHAGAAEIEAAEDGLCDAVAFWFDLELGEEEDGTPIGLSTAPCEGEGDEGGPRHWTQAFCLLPEPLPVRRGARYALRATAEDCSVRFGLRPADDASPAPAAAEAPGPTPRALFPLLNDESRTAALVGAVERAVRAAGPACALLELGCGTALLAMAAARAGAAAVVDLEEGGPARLAARAVLAASGVAGRVQVADSPSGGPFGVVASGAVDAALLHAEGALSAFAHAARFWRRVEALRAAGAVAAGARLVPAGARLVGMAVRAPRLARAYDALEPAAHAGFDLAAALECRAADHAELPLSAGDWEALGPPAALLALDFARPPTPLEADAAVPVERDGEAHALLLWLEVEADGEARFATGPEAGGFPRQMVRFLPAPAPLRRGCPLPVRVAAMRAGEELELAFPTLAPAPPPGPLLAALGEPAPLAAYAALQALRERLAPGGGGGRAALVAALWAGLVRELRAGAGGRPPLVANAAALVDRLLKDGRRLARAAPEAGPGGKRPAGCGDDGDFAEAHRTAFLAAAGDAPILLASLAPASRLGPVPAYALLQLLRGLLKSAAAASELAAELPPGLHPARLLLASADALLACVTAAGEEGAEARVNWAPVRQKALQVLLELVPGPAEREGRPPPAAPAARRLAAALATAPWAAGGGEAEAGEERSAFVPDAAHPAACERPLRRLATRLLLRLAAAVPAAAPAALAAALGPVRPRPPPQAGPDHDAAEGGPRRRLAGLLGTLAAQDDALVEGLFCLLRAAAADPRAPDPCDAFAAAFAAGPDASELLLDLLISNETAFLPYFLAFLAHVARPRPRPAPPAPPSALADLAASYESDEEGEGEGEGEGPPALAGCLHELEAKVARLAAKNLFPYRSAPLLRRLRAALAALAGAAPPPPPP